jgi:hypothetical protein
VHNGGHYVGELIESIRRQDHVHWSLLVADDGSSDSSMAIVARHAAVDPRISVVAVRKPGSALGPARSFMELLGHVAADEVFAFCDQDDVWFRHKLSWTLRKLAELRSSSDIAAVATDAIVTDAQLEQLAPSALALHHVGRDVTLGRLFVNNIAIGSTMVGTGRLARLARELGASIDIRMHDWWCVLVAAYGGAFEVLAAPTMYWRRHDSTVTGTQPGGVRVRVERRLSAIAWSSVAARELLDHLVPADGQVRRVAVVMANVDADTMTPIDLVRMRRAGIRAWSSRHDINLLVATIAQLMHRR